MTYWASCCCNQYVALVPCKGATGVTLTDTVENWTLNYGITDFTVTLKVTVGGVEWCAVFEPAASAGFPPPVGTSLSPVSGCGDPACLGVVEYFIFTPCDGSVPCTFSMAATNADWGTLLGLPDPAPGQDYDLSGTWKFVATDDSCCGVAAPCHDFCGTISPDPVTEGNFCDATCPSCDVPDGQVKLIDDTFTLGTFEEVVGAPSNCTDAPECQPCRPDPCDKPYLKVTGVTRIRVKCDLEISGSCTDDTGSAVQELTTDWVADVEFDVAIEWEHYLQANAATLNPEDVSGGTPLCDIIWSKHEAVESYIRTITFNRNVIDVSGNYRYRPNSFTPYNEEVFTNNGTFQLVLVGSTDNGLDISCGNIFKRKYLCEDSICASTSDPQTICPDPGCYATFGNEYLGRLQASVVTTTTAGGFTCTGPVVKRTPNFRVASLLSNPEAISCCCDTNYFTSAGLVGGNGRHLGWNWGNITSLFTNMVFRAADVPDNFDNCPDGFFETLSYQIFNADGGFATIDEFGDEESFDIWTGDRCQLEGSIYGPCFADGGIWDCDALSNSWTWNYVNDQTFHSPTLTFGPGFSRRLEWLLFQSETVTSIECVDALP